MLRSTIILALAGLSAAKLSRRNAHKGGQANLLLPGANSQALSVSLLCSSFEDECDIACVPSGSACCFVGDGSYCDPGKTCESNGCCDEGEDCGGEVSDCDDGLHICGDYCMPEDAVCCDRGTYCDAGETCTSDGFCETGGSSSDDSDSTSDGDTCYSFQEECDGYCMPTGSVCCGGGHYCSIGETCGDNGQCNYGVFGDDDDADDDSTLCKRRKGGGGSGGGDSGDGGDGGGDGDAGGFCCNCSGSNTISAPLLLAGVAVLASLSV